MSILVTGGAGYIGAHIVDKLCREGEDVIVLDNLCLGFKENLNDDSTFYEGDILDDTDLNFVFKKHDITTVIHMAAFKAAGESMINPEKYTKNNIFGSLNLISKSIKYGVEKFIFSSSAAVYGNPMYSPIDEEHKRKPINHYGYTKLYVEKYLEWISQVQMIKFASLRYFNASGYSDNINLIKFMEKKPQNLLPIIMEVANGERSQLDVFGNNYNTSDGTCVRDYIHVMDLADAHYKAISYLDQNKSIALNLSSGLGFSVLDVVREAQAITHKEIIYKVVERRDGDPDELISISRKAEENFNWVPQYSSLENIISSMWKFYQK